MDSGFLKEHLDRVALALGADDIQHIQAAGKVAVIESFLNARSLGTDLSGIDTFYNAGVRIRAYACWQQRMGRFFATDRRSCG